MMETEMTMEVIQSRFDSEWVLVENPRTNEALEVLSGHVLHHSKDSPDYS
jgi:hypothetical protein